MLQEIEPILLFLVRVSKVDESIDHFKQHKGYYESPDTDRELTENLDSRTIQ